MFFGISSVWDENRWVMTRRPTGDEMRYDLFISYSHSDTQTARKLQRILARIGQPWYRFRGLRVFRDATDLSANPHLWSSIEHALIQSNWLLLLASPDAARSPWVNKEVERWLDERGTGTLLIGIAAGRIAWDNETDDFDWSETNALPRCLVKAFSAAPLYVDLREFQPNAGGAEIRQRAAAIAAPIMGVELADIVGIDVSYRRQALRLVCAGIAVFVALVLLSIVFGDRLIAWHRIERANSSLQASGATWNDANASVEFRRSSGPPISEEQWHDVADAIRLKSPLSTIRIDGARIHSIAFLKHSPSLKRLFIATNFLDTYDERSKYVFDWTAIESLGELEEFILRYAPFYDSDARRLASMKKLKVVMLTGVLLSSDGVMELITNSPQMTSLALVDCDDVFVDKEVADKIRDLPCLAKLEINGVRMSQLARDSLAERDSYRTHRIVDLMIDIQPPARSSGGTPIE